MITATKEKVKKKTKTEIKREEEFALQQSYLDMWDRNNYKLIHDYEQLHEVLTFIGDEFAIDTETSGLDIRKGYTDLYGISISSEEGTAYWIPKLTVKMKRLFHKKFKKSTVIMANAKYDIPILENHGMKVCDFADVFIGMHLTFPNDRGGGLKGLADTHLTGIGQTLLMHKLLQKPKSKIETGDFLLLDKRTQRIYGAQDADLTWRLWQSKPCQDAKRDYPEIWKLEHDIIRPTIHLETVGIRIDKELMLKQDAILEAEYIKLSKRVNEIARKHLGIKDLELNIRSTQQKSNLIFGQWDKDREVHDESKALRNSKGEPIRPIVRTDSGRGSTGKKFLGALRNENEAIDLILKASSLSTLRSHFTSKIPNELCDDGKLRGSFWPIGAATGRFTSSKPNLQNIPKCAADYIPVNIRDCFTADEGWILINPDSAQIELRIAASLSGETVWIDAFADGISPHVATAVEMFGKNYTEDEYKKSKNMNFGIVYGQTAYAFAMMYGISEDEAQGFIDRWKKAVPALTAWVERQRRECERTGIATTHFGRVRPMSSSIYDDNIWSSQRSIVESWKRKGVNFIVQGTAVDLLKMSMVRAYKQITQVIDFPLQMLLTVHDELLFDGRVEVPDMWERIHPEIKTPFDSRVDSDWH